jgi:CHAT domain-containing protein
LGAAPVPLHACRLADGRRLIDAFDEVTFTPSLSILHSCAGMYRPSLARLLTAENPTGDLAFPEVEAAAAGRHFALHTRRRDQVHRAQLLADGAGRDVWHYTGHSFFQPDDPMASGLLLADGVLSLSDIYTDLRLRDTALAVLSGCESGGVRPDRTDDYAGLPGGLLYAGATCVLSSLWCVDDPATAVLMDAFYREWREKGRSVAAALVNAQRWLRDATGPQIRDELMNRGFFGPIDDPDQRDRCRTWADAIARRYPDRPPFSSPAYWAAFTAVGWSMAPQAAPR